ncbi:MAG: hypothetical protein KatS3mg076_2892 [Candidatus Binatia bacterium]|nr:MAG: hypothetical protein KatS3mg076_2892 [Candidatus Binatia bacterium]
MEKRSGPKQQELFSRVPPHRNSETHRPDGLVPRYTFASFVVGSGNQFAHAAALAVAHQPGERYNPLFLYGGVGLGKTHLANAIGHELLARRPEARVLYLSAEAFMNELITALRKNRVEEFKARFRRVDLLILDDVEFLAGRERTQEEFFHTFNTLWASQRQIVLTSDKSPKELEALEERLRSRFEWGLTVDIQPPDLETRVAIVEKKADAQGLRLPHEVALLVANHARANVRELESCLNRLEAVASLEGVEITADLARRVLESMGQGKTGSMVTIDEIKRVVCEHFRLSPSHLLSRRRSRNLTFPRQLAMYLCRKHTPASYPVIGNEFGGRDHTTVIHAINVVEAKLRKDPALRLLLDKLEQSLQDGA